MDRRSAFRRTGGIYQLAKWESQCFIWVRSPFRHLWELKLHNERKTRSRWARVQIHWVRARDIEVEHKSLQYSFMFRPRRTPTSADSYNASSISSFSIQSASYVRKPYGIAAHAADWCNKDGRSGLQNTTYVQCGTSPVLGTLWDSGISTVTKN